MLIEICLTAITVTLIILAIGVMRLSSQAQRTIHLLRMDMHSISKEVMHLVNNLNEFVRADLHLISKDTKHVLSNLKDLSSDINNKTKSLNFLFKPLNFLNSELSSDSSSDESRSISETIPQILKWIASSIFLYKTTKELIKNHEK